MSKKPKHFLHWHFPPEPDDAVLNGFDEEFAQFYEFPEFENDNLKRNINSDPLMDEETDWNGD